MTAPQLPDEDGLSDELQVPDYLMEMLAEEPVIATQLFQLFLSETTSNLNALDESLSAVDAQETSRLVHTMKGSCSQMGALVMARLCARLESRATAGDLAGCQEWVPALRSSFAKVRSGVCAMLPAGPEA